MKDHLNTKKLIIIYIISGLLIAADQITKHIVSKNLVYGQKNIIIDGFFNLTYCGNTGGAWSLFSGKASILAVISLVSSLFILVVIFYCKNTILAFSLGVVLAGAIGNMLDRLIHGYVVDFLDFRIFGYDFPVFNVADICVVCGGVGMILTVLFSKHDKQLFYRPGFLSRKEVR